MAFSGRQATGPTMAGSRSGYPEHHSRYQRAAVGIGGGEGVGAGCSGHAPQQSESSRAISSGATRSGSCGRTNGVAGLATTSAVPANVLDRGPSTDGGGCADTIRAEAPGGELMLFDDGSLSSDKGQSNAMSLVLNCAEPHVAAGTAVFGIGLLVLPFLARLEMRDPADVDSVFSYDGHLQKAARGNASAPIFREAQLRDRLGEIDVARLRKEIVMSTNQLDEYMNNSSAAVIEAETTNLRKWRDKANSHMKSLQKRSGFHRALRWCVCFGFLRSVLGAALAFLGLPPGASESEIGKMYKKMALELHPDKGGDPEKFQELQDMKERLAETNEEDEKKQTEEEERDEEEARKAREKENADDPQEPQDRIKKLRMDVHDNITRLWSRAKKAKDEIVGDKAVKLNSQPAVNVLRVFVDRFVSHEIKTLRHDDARGAEAKFRKFVHQGAEIIAVAAAHDVQATLSTVAMNFNFRICGRSGSAEVHEKCKALLEAIAEIPTSAEAFLKDLDDSLAAAQDLDRREKEERAAKQREREAAGDYSGDASKPPAATTTSSNPCVGGGAATAGVTPTNKAAAPPFGVAPGRPTVPPTAKTSSPQSMPQSSAPKSSDPFADFDFSAAPASRAPPAAASAPASQALVRPVEAEQRVSAAKTEKRTSWEPEFDHPYAGALKSNGRGIFCRPCQRWIPTWDYCTEPFLLHAQHVHPRPPTNWS
eukprot:TRINITY_DN7510_c0_g1_i4.p1 TRINITY_DN7510_c0_g1~~TRINITY_DN7510_c0_g1_i4.p1  ORF type:complete len:709 (-),score=156.83 TRINITY_DN7510_c0_g1_i4:174-2300(-)